MNQTGNPKNLYWNGRELGFWSDGERKSDIIR
jgi:hypothetical protein